MRVLVVPNLKLYEKVIRPEIEENTHRKQDAEMVVEAIFNALKLLEDDDIMSAAGVKRENGDSGEDLLKEQLARRIGEVMADRVWKSGNIGLARTILDSPPLGVHN